MISTMGLIRNSNVVTRAVNSSQASEKNRYRFQVVKLISKEPAGQRELADPRVQQAIRTQLRDRREQLLKAAYYEVLRDQARVENYYAQKVLDGNGTAQ